MRYAIDVLKVRDVPVVGHYGCGGGQAVYENDENGELDNWLCHLRDVQKRHCDEIEAMTDKAARLERLCELNVITQVGNVCRTQIVQQAWQSGQSLAVRGAGIPGFARIIFRGVAGSALSGNRWQQAS